MAWKKVLCKVKVLVAKFEFMSLYIVTITFYARKMCSSLAPLAQLAERRSHNPEVVSSILTGSTSSSFAFCLNTVDFLYSFFFSTAVLCFFIFPVIKSIIELEPILYAMLKYSFQHLVIPCNLGRDEDTNARYSLAYSPHWCSILLSGIPILTT